MKTQQITKAIFEKATPEFIEEVVKKGYAGVTADGGLVDRRANPEAVAIQKNSKLGIPDPVDLSTPHSSPPSGGQGQPPEGAQPNAKKSMRFRFSFVFEILDGVRRVVGRKTVSTESESEAEAIEAAIAKLEIPDGCTHRYTGEFKRTVID